MNTNGIRLGILLVGMSSLSVYGVDAVWDIDTYATSGTFVVPKYWKANGETLAVAPTNAADNVEINAKPSYSLFINLGNNDTTVSADNGGSCRHVTFNAIASTWFPYLNLQTKNNCGDLYPLVTVDVGEPDGYQGFWTSANGRGEILLRKASATYTPKLSHINTRGYMGVNVPEGGCGEVESLYRNGALLKRGKGDLKVDHAAGWDSRIYCQTGSLIIAGLADTVPVDKPAPGAWLHLDASRADTLETFVDADNRICVAKWSDCDGGAVYALTNDFRGSAAHLLNYSRAPYISPDRSPSGLPLVDFGLCIKDLSSTVPSNCWMRFSAECTNVREVFWAARHTSSVGTTLIGHTEEGYYHFSNNSTFFSSDASPALRDPAAPLFFNGQRCSWRQINPSRYGDQLSKFHVVSAGSLEPLRCNALCTDRRYSYYSCGWQVGEVIIYDRVLTPDEREGVNRYLMAKWHQIYRPDDVGEVVLASREASITVPAGQVARVKSVAVTGGRLVKKGAGRLVVDAITPVDTAVEVEGGSITVRAPEVDDSAPAADPYFWIDASQTSSLVFSNDTAFVTRWNDRRADHTAVYAEVPIGQGTVYDTDANICGHLPWRVEAASPTGLDAVDFGQRWVAPRTCTFMWMQPHGTSEVHAAFIAVKANTKGHAQDYFGSTSVDMLRNTNNYMLQDAWSSPNSIGVAWAFDGMPVDPFQYNNALYDDTSWHVVSMASGEEKLRVDLLAKYTLNQSGYAGGIQIGEMVLFDRKISAEERRQTEAYLMKRWLGRNHPESAAGQGNPEYSFDPATDAVLDTDANLTVTNALGGTGTIVKRGAGALSYSPGEYAPTNLTAVVVEQGSATIPLDLVDTGKGFRFDASDLASFTETVVTEDEMGVLSTNVLTWKDQRTGLEAYSATRTGISASYAGASGSSVTNPMLVQAEMPDGALRPAVDFGNWLNVATLWQGNPRVIKPQYSSTRSAGMKFKNCDQVTAPYKNFHEAHVVVADQDTSKGMFFTAWTTQVKGALDLCNRNTTSGELFSPGGTSHPGVREGAIWMDGVATNCNAKMPAGFHLISVQPCEPTNYLSIATISMDRNCNSGGNKICEYIGYEEAHSPEVVEYIMAALQHKWFGAARPVWVTTFARLEVAKDATLTLDTRARVKATTLAGGGTITAPDIAGVSRLEIPGAVDELTVAGKVTLADTGVVALTENGLVLEVGEYPLFTATELVANLAGWTVTADVSKTSRLSLRRDGNTITLVVLRPGTMVYFR